jgi:preprotein translocase subunit YajC
MINTLLTNTTGGGLGSMLMLILPIALLVILFVVSSRSQKKKDKEIADMRNNLSIGDEVTTIGGIIGKIVSIKEETCVIVTSRDNTKIRILKSAISHVDVKAEDSID